MKKKTAFSICMVLISFLGISQENQRNILGIRAGINFQNINGKEFDGSTTDNDMKMGFHAGITAQFPIATDFYFQSGILFSTKGATQKASISGNSIKSTVTLGYLEVPFNLLYKPVLGSGRLLLGFGPYIGYGITGNSKYETSGTDNGSSERDVIYTSEVNATDNNGNIYFKPFDAGANLLFGYEFSNRVSAQLNTQLGLVKINPEYNGVADDKRAYKNTGFGVSIGYLF